MRSYDEGDIDDEDDWNWCSMFWAFISALFCPFFGLIATIFAGLAYADFLRDGEGSRKRCCAWTCCTIALVLGIGLTALMLCVLFLANSGNNDTEQIISDINKYAIGPVIDKSLSILSPVARLVNDIAKVIKDNMEKNDSSSVTNNPVTTIPTV